VRNEKESALKMGADGAHTDCWSKSTVVSHPEILIFVFTTGFICFCMCALSRLLGGSCVQTVVSSFCLHEPSISCAGTTIPHPPWPKRSSASVVHFIYLFNLIVFLGILLFI